MIDEIVGTANTISAGVTGVVDTLSAFAAKLEQWKKVKSETHSTIRLLYLEICKDLELMAILIEDKNRDIKWNDKGVRFFIDNFGTGVMEMVLLGNEKEDVYKRLSQKGKISERNDLVGKAARNTQKYENVLQAIRFIYVKIDILRKLLKESDDNELLKRIKVVERMKNIESRLLVAKAILGKFEENKSIG